MTEIGLNSGVDVQVIRASPSFSDWIITIFFYVIIGLVIYYVYKKKVKNRWKKQENIESINEVY